MPIQDFTGDYLCKGCGTRINYQKGSLSGECGTCGKKYFSENDLTKVNNNFNSSAKGRYLEKIIEILNKIKNEKTI